MSVQIFLQGKLLGIEEFLLSGAVSSGGGFEPTSEAEFTGRSHWIALLSEVLPRALLAELGLAKILLGSSGGGQFLVVLPDEARQPAEEFLNAARLEVEALSGGRLRLVWAVTENLGDWSDVRKRLNEAMERNRNTPAAGRGPAFFAPGTGGLCEQAGVYFRQLAADLPAAERLGWNPDQPARVVFEEARHNWPLTQTADAIALARHIAPADNDGTGAGREQLGRRAADTPVWGVLRGDVDGFSVRIRRAQTIEEHIHLSYVYKQFFAGELQLLCSVPDFWRKVTIVYSGGDDFAVYGAWDALVGLAREMQRLFHRLSEENLREFPGAEGKTITMALALATDPASPLASVFGQAGERLEIAKSAGKDCFYLFGRTLEWRLLNDAAEMKDMMVRMVREFGCSPQFLAEIGGFYNESTETASLGKRTERGNHFDRPWRFNRRLSRAMGGPRDREFQKLRTSLFNEFVARGTAQLKLRPAGRAALEWARLLTAGIEKS
ncbi:MAG: hypothetical protein IT160_00540 [Bryobacterales bacterium]|nr:hypothetical protein [Bryobacterales bacterium]